jgi:hypothetical protein
MSPGGNHEISRQARLAVGGARLDCNSFAKTGVVEIRLRGRFSPILECVNSTAL